MRCAVFHCNNNNKQKEKKFWFYSFPKEETLQKKWVDFCRRGDHFNIKTSRICCEHFTPNDIMRNLQYEMGFCTQNSHKLKPGTVPSVYVEKDSLAPESSKENNCIETNDTDQQMQIKRLTESVNKMKTTVNNLKRENFVLRGKEKSLTRQVDSLKQQLSKREFEKTDNRNVKLQEIFNESQVKKLKKEIKKLLLMKTNKQRFNTFYSVYKLLKKKNFLLLMYEQCASDSNIILK